MIAKYVVMRIMKCKKCGYPHNPDTEGDRCRMCGWGAFTCVYEEIEETDGTKLLSISHIYRKCLSFL